MREIENFPHVTRHIPQSQGAADRSWCLGAAMHGGSGGGQDILGSGTGACEDMTAGKPRSRRISQKGARIRTSDNAHDSSGTVSGLHSGGLCLTNVTLVAEDSKIGVLLILSRTFCLLRLHGQRLANVKAVLHSERRQAHRTNLGLKFVPVIWRT